MSTPAKPNSCKPVKLLFKEEPTSQPDNLAGLLAAMPRTKGHYQKWAVAAPLEEVQRLLDHVERHLINGPRDAALDFAMMIQMELELVVGNRTGRWFTEDGVEIPSWVLEASTDMPSAGCDGPPPAHRVSRRGRRRGKVAPSMPRGFLHHSRADRTIRDEVLRRARAAHAYEMGRRREEDLLFYEVPGEAQLFSIREMAELHADLDSHYGRENRKMVCSLFHRAITSGNRRNIARAPSSAAIASLREKFPNASEVLDHVDRAVSLARMSVKGHFEMDPLMVHGEPGIGKTAVLQAIAESVKIPFKRLDLGAMSMGSMIFGLSMGWATGRPGEIYNLLVGSRFMNPIVLLDEIDKAEGNGNSPVAPGLLALLERETSRNFRDEAMLFAIDASRIIWFSAANNLHPMNSALRSRFTEVHMQRPEGEHAVSVAQSIYASLRKRNPWGQAFPEELDRSLALDLAGYVPREMSRRLMTAFGEAARQGRAHLTKDDFPGKMEVRRRIGFVG